MYNVHMHAKKSIPTSVSTQIAKANYKICNVIRISEVTVRRRY